MGFMERLSGKHQIRKLEEFLDGGWPPKDDQEQTPPGTQKQRGQYESAGMQGPTPNTSRVNSNKPGQDRSRLRGGVSHGMSGPNPRKI